MTRPGREVVHRAALQLRKARGDGGPLRVLSSPLRRARETAEAVVGVLSPHPELSEVELHDDLATDAGLPLDLVRELAAAGTDTLLVGHQPTVEALVCRLLQRVHLSLPGGFRTATIVALELVATPDRWQPGSVLDPHVDDR